MTAQTLIAELPDLGRLDRRRIAAPDFVASLFRGDYRPFHRPEHMKMLLDSLRKRGWGSLRPRLRGE